MKGVMNPMERIEIKLPNSAMQEIDPLGGTNAQVPQ